MRYPAEDSAHSYLTITNDDAIPAPCVQLQRKNFSYPHTDVFHINDIHCLDLQPSTTLLAQEPHWLTDYSSYNGRTPYKTIQSTALLAQEPHWLTNYSSCNGRTPHKTITVVLYHTPSPVPALSQKATMSNVEQLKISSEAKVIADRWRVSSSVGVMQEALGFDSLSGTPIASQADVIIVGIDVECYEHEPRSLTEFGVSVLDTRDVRNAAPGPNGELWLEWVYNYRFCMQETGQMENGQFVANHPDDFKFGHTKWITIPEARNILKEMFQVPTNKPDEFRSVIFLGHALQGDSKLIRKYLGVDVEAMGTVVAWVDTQTIARSLNIRGSG